MKNLIMAVALTTALMGASVAVAEDASQSLSFEDAEKMEQMSEQDKQQKGAGTQTWLDTFQQVNRTDVQARQQNSEAISRILTSGGQAIKNWWGASPSPSPSSPPPLTGHGSIMPPTTNFPH